MPNRWPISSGNWSNAAIWSGSLIPTASDDVFANTFTVNMDTSFQVLSLNSIATTGVAAGGSFNFNTAGVSGSITSTVPLSAGANNLIQITAITGTVTLSLGGNVEPRGGTGESLILHSGNCNFVVSGGNFSSSTTGTPSNNNCINKTSNGTITINGTLLNNATGTGNSLISTAGNTIVVGNVRGANNSFGTSRGINQSGGILTITGSITGGTAAASNQGIVFSGTSLIVNGNIVGGSVAAAIDSTSPVIVTGDVSGSAAAGIVTTAPVVVTGNVIARAAAAAINAGSSAVFINVSGSVISSATANAINATNASAVVNLAGNMVNTGGKTAIYCQNLFLSDTATTQAQFFTVGSQDRTLYSADTFPNLPSASNVRFGTTYGPGSGNTGTLRMASPQDVRSGVLTDNTTGSAILSIESLSNEVRTSTDPFARRLGNIATVDVVGNLLTAFKK